MSPQLLLSIAFAIVFLALVGGLLRFLRNHVFRTSLEEETPIADRESLANYYRPMLRLLDERELQAARSLAHLRPGDYRRFRLQRIEAFQLYLNELSTDFRRIEFKLRYLLLAAPAQYGDLVRELNRNKAQFHWQLAKLRLYLVMFRFGWVTIDATKLVESLVRLDAVLRLRPAQG
jgi:hypothetical protein